MAKRLVPLFAFALVVVGCGEDGDSASTTTSAPATTTSTSLPAATTTSTAEPATDAQDGIDWFVEVLNGQEVSAAEYEARFTEEFREQVAFEEGFQPVLDQFRPAGPYTVTERDGQGAQGAAVVEAADGTRSRVIVELDDQGRFAGLLIQPADVPTLDDPPETVDEAFARLAEMGSVGVTTAEVIGDECVAIEEVSPGDPIPLGSVFKLYVLAALGEAVRDGDIAWDDEIEIRDELKSVPSGVLQDRPAGETVTVGEMAELMISISDNTATDHLIDLLGRETVEATMATYGHSSPELNTPLLNTRELTALKVGPASGLYVQWIEGDEQTRRDLLRQISDITPGDLPVQEWSDPIEPDTVEWFASPQDLCHLAMLLSALMDDVPEIGEILAINPGVPAEAGTWEEIWFKGGSEPGLVAVWWVTESDGRTFVTTGSVVSPDTAFDSEEAVLLFAAARDLLAP